MNEEQIKILIKNDLENYKDTSIAEEFSFDFGQRRADIVFANQDIATCIEIKSERDSTRRLPWQLEGYTKYFDFVYVACTPNHLNNVLKNSPKNIGVVLINGESLEKVRKAKQQKQLDKITLLSTCNITSLTRIKNNYKHGKYELIKEISPSLKREECRIISRKDLISKIKRDITPL